MDEAKKWVVYVDASSTQYAEGIVVILKSLERDKLKYAAHLQYQTTNNEVEYEALLKGARICQVLRGRVNSCPRKLSIDHRLNKWNM